jgi:AraC family transcriptional regulator
MLQVGQEEPCNDREHCPMPTPSRKGLPPASGAQAEDATAAEHRSANEAMSRILNMQPIRIAMDPAGGAITQWRHDAVHDVLEPMSEHVVTTYTGTPQRMERRTGRSLATGTARSGIVAIIPAGSSARWDIFGPVNVVQLYLPQSTLDRVAGEAGIAAPVELLERTGHPDPITSRLLQSAADVLEGNGALDVLFRQQMMELLATRLVVAHAGSQTQAAPVVGGLAPKVLQRTIERLRSDSDTDVSLAALAADAGLSRFHLCRAFKESTGLSPHAWLRQHRLDQAMTMLRDTDDSVASIAAALGYSSQTAFAAAFRKLTNETPSDWRRLRR